MKREIIFRDGSSKKGKRISLNIEIKNKEIKNFAENKPCLSISGTYKGGGGQIVDDIIPKNEYQKELIEIWKKYHLNNMNARTEKQKKLLEQTKDQHKYDYNKIVKILDCYNHESKLLNCIEQESFIAQRNEEIKTRKEIQEKINKLKTEVKEEIRKLKSNRKCLISTTKKRNLKEKQYFVLAILKQEYFAINQYIEKLEKQLANRSNDVFFKTLLHDYHPKTNKPYKYGSEWLYSELPEGIEERINFLCDNIEKETIPNDKIHPLKLWLQKTNSSLSMSRKAKQRYFHEDTEERDVYNCRLRNEKGFYDFTFGSSLNDTAKGKSPEVEDVLYCLETVIPVSFEDFCNDFGYDEDSRKAFDIYKAVKDQAEEINELFSKEEIEELEEAKQSY